VAAEHEADEIRADEAAPAGDEKFHCFGARKKLG
jgi:hypothetical protein